MIIEFLEWIRDCRPEYAQIFANGIVDWRLSSHYDPSKYKYHHLLNDLIYKHKQGYITLTQETLNYVRVSPIELTKLIMEFNNRGK